MLLPIFIIFKKFFKEKKCRTRETWTESSAYNAFTQVKETCQRKESLTLKKKEFLCLHIILFVICNVFKIISRSIICINKYVLINDKIMCKREFNLYSTQVFKFYLTIKVQKCFYLVSLWIVKKNNVHCISSKIQNRIDRYMILSPHKIIS